MPLEGEQRRADRQAPEGPRETESPDFLDCTLMDGLLSLLPVVSPADCEGQGGGTQTWKSAWNVVVVEDQP